MPQRGGEDEGMKFRPPDYDTGPQWVNGWNSYVMRLLENVEMNLRQWS